MLRTGTRPRWGACLAQHYPRAQLTWSVALLADKQPASVRRRVFIDAPLGNLGAHSPSRPDRRTRQYRLGRADRSADSDQRAADAYDSRPVVSIVGEGTEEVLPGLQHRGLAGEDVVVGIDEGVAIGHQLSERVQIPPVDCIVDCDHGAMGDTIRVATVRSHHAANLPADHLTENAARLCSAMVTSGAGGSSPPPRSSWIAPPRRERRCCPSPSAGAPGRAAADRRVRRALRPGPARRPRSRTTPDPRRPWRRHASPPDAAAR